MEDVLEQAQVFLATDQGRFEPAVSLCALHTRQHAHRTPKVQRHGLAFDRVLSRVLIGDGQRGRLARDAVHEHCARLRRRLGARRGVDTVADDQAFSGPVHRGRLARHDPGAGLQSRDPDLHPESAHRVHQLQPSAHRPFGVVLARNGRAPDSHHRVADELLKGPAVALDDRAGIVEVAPEEFADVLGVARLRERRVADDVHEQHRDEPQLRDGGFRRRLLCREARTTLAAELLPLLIRRGARGAAEVLCGAALDAELPVVRNLDATVPTDHDALPRTQVQKA